MIITIDGPAGTGKSTVAHRVAQKLGFKELDTGALYRAVAAGCLSFQINPHDGQEVGEFLRAHPLLVDLSTPSPTYWINGKDVTPLIRSLEVTSLLSQPTPMFEKSCCPFNVRSRWEAISSAKEEIWAQPFFQRQRGSSFSQLLQACALKDDMTNCEKKERCPLPPPSRPFVSKSKKEMPSTREEQPLPYEKPPTLSK